MSFPSRIQEFLKNNDAFAETYKSPPGILTIADLTRKSGQGTLILTCLDPRVIPEEYFGPNIRAGVIRNAGGRVTQDTIRSVVVLRSLADVKNLLVVHHTDCGMTHLSDERIANEARERTPDAAAEIDELKFDCFTAEGYEESIKKDVILLRNTKALAGMNIYGFGMDINTGIVKPLDI